MKPPITLMKARFQVLTVFGLVTVLGPGLTSRAVAATDDAFDALKENVRQLGEKVEKLERQHEQDQKANTNAQQQIQQLQQQLGETQRLNLTSELNDRISTVHRKKKT